MFINEVLSSSFMKKVHYFNIRMEEELWEQFKEKVPQSTTLNSKIVSLIEGVVKNGG